MPDRPDIVFFHVDNLGMGELGCYGGGILRGADTRRADRFAAEGPKLSHYVVERVAENTIVVFAGDNGAEDHIIGRGTGGFFDGSYFSSAEGGIGTPCLIRYPGNVPAGRETNELVHVTDMFATLLGWAGCEIPQDRKIDGLDQRALFRGEQDASDRESCIVWLNEELHAVKWGQFKINFKWQQHFHDPELPVGFARITNLPEDSKEWEPVNQSYVRWWVMQHAHRAVREFNESAGREQLIPSGAPLDFVPETYSRVGHV